MVLLTYHQIDHIYTNRVINTNAATNRPRKGNGTLRSLSYIHDFTCKTWANWEKLEPLLSKTWDTTGYIFQVQWYEEQISIPSYECYKIHNVTIDM